MSGFDQSLKNTIRERDEHRCARCRTFTPAGEGACHHRRARGMGSSRRTGTNDLSNIVLLCARCHDWTEQFPRSAFSLGWRLKQWQDPRESPLMRGSEWWQPSETWERVEAPEAAVT